MGRKRDADERFDRLGKEMDRTTRRVTELELKQHAMQLELRRLSAPAPERGEWPELFVVGRED